VEKEELRLRRLANASHLASYANVETDICQNCWYFFAAWTISSKIIWQAWPSIVQQKCLPLLSFRRWNVLRYVEAEPSPRRRVSDYRTTGGQLVELLRIIFVKGSGSATRVEIQRIWPVLAVPCQFCNLVSWLLCNRVGSSSQRWVGRLQLEFSRLKICYSYAYASRMQDQSSMKQEQIMGHGTEIGKAWREIDNRENLGN
jgi:hypothetical protein